MSTNGHDDDPLPQPLDWQALHERGEPPARDWALDYWIGMGHVTLLSGIGGIGKSILAQQIGTAIALGQSCISAVKAPRIVIGWMGEDDEREIWARQLAVCRHFDVTLDQMHGRMSLYALDRAECCLLDWFEGKPLRTSNLKLLQAQIGDLRAEVVILDNIGRLYGCNENDRHQVSSFFAALQWACSPTNAAVVLIGHVAKVTQSEFAGSTAWENAARARLWFSDKPPDHKPDKDDDDIPEDLRYLSKRKVNYTSRDLAVLRYVNGAYDVVTAPAGSLIANIEKGQALERIRQAIPKLDALHYTCSDARTSQNYLPYLMMKHNLAGTLTKSQLVSAMNQLVGDGELIRNVEKTGNRSTSRVRLSLK